MKTNNKCYFSISLENGITITGNTPDEVKTFISDIDLCVGDAIKSGLNDKYPNYKEYLYELRTNLTTAWATIYINQNKERE